MSAVDPGAAKGALPPVARRRHPLITAFKFAVEMIVGTFIFLLIAGLAVFLGNYVHGLEEKGFDKAIVFGLKVTEYLIFALDILSFWRFLVKTFIHNWKDI